LNIAKATFCRRVVSSDGSSFQTSASSASEYIFNHVFMVFLGLCIILYASVMETSETVELAVPAQMMIWAAVFMSSLIWLLISVWANIVLVDTGYAKFILVPAILLPMLVANVYMIEFVLAQFSTTYEDAFGSKLEFYIRTGIVLICLDIFHGRFVAPQHPTYISPDLAPQSDVNVSVSGDATPVTAKERKPAPTISEANVTPPAPDTGEPKGEPSNTGPMQIEIAKTKINACSILWIKSEDHYLNIQMTDRNVMLRGKLRAAVSKLGDDFGIQINRSFWVAFAAIQTVDEKPNGHIELHLEDNSVQRIASTRSLIFMHSYNRFTAAMDAQTA
jgi:hypothetical protein